VKGVAKLVEEGLDLESFRSWGEEKIIEEMSQIRGVGVWTAEMTMIGGCRNMMHFLATT